MRVFTAFWPSCLIKVFTALMYLRLYISSLNQGGCGGKV